VRAALFLVGLLAACGGGGSHDSCHATGYPCGPYGYARGSVVADLTLTGQRDSDGTGSAVDDPVAPIHLHDYFQDATLTALVIVIGTVSCVPCQNEQPTLVASYRAHQPQAAFLEAIVQGAAGAPADTSVVDAWAANYSLPFDLTADPTQALAQYYPANAFPSAMVIRTSDMTIVYQVVGPADGLDAALTQL
jgi:AhpC/TSA family